MIAFLYKYASIKLSASFRFMKDIALAYEDVLYKLEMKKKEVEKLKHENEHLRHQINIIKITKGLASMEDVLESTVAKVESLKNK